MKKYALKYDFKYEISAEGFTKEEVKQYGKGGADALVITSILRAGKKAHDGAVSHAFLSIDGQNEGKPIPNTELFTMFSMLANHLSECDDLPAWQKQLCSEVFEVIREVVVSNH